MIFLVVIICIGVGVSYLLHIRLWLSIVLVALGVFVNGLIATWEDERPGGFNNPN